MPKKQGCMTDSIQVLLLVVSRLSREIDMWARERCHFTGLCIRTPFSGYNSRYALAFCMRWARQDIAVSVNAKTLNELYPGRSVIKQIVSGALSH